MMTVNKNVPKLRFPEFSVELRNEILGKISTFSKGKGISKADIDENGTLDCIRYGQLYTEYSEVIDSVISKTNIDASNLILSEGNDVIIPASGESQIDIATASCVLKAGIALGGDLNIIRTKEDGVFLSYYLNNAKKFDIASLAQGISVVHLYASQLKTIKVSLPTLPEQQKIATFLTAVDQRIRLLEEKKQHLERYKQGVMQKLFSQEIRFKGDNGNDFAAWEEKKLGEVGLFIGGGTPDTNIEEYWDGLIPWVSSSDLEENSISKISKTRFITQIAIESSATKLVKKGSVLIVSRVGVGKFAVADEDLCTSQDFTNMKTDQDSYFVAYYFSFAAKTFVCISQGTSIKGFNSQDLKSLKFRFPSLPEQQKIAKFLSAIDQQIEQIGVQVGQSQEFKKGLLQQMFV
jgi:type I restriction enzyme S subunit